MVSRMHPLKLDTPGTIDGASPPPLLTPEEYDRGVEDLRIVSVRREERAA